MIWVVKREVRMATKRHSAEQIVRKLREAEVELARGATALAVFEVSACGLRA